MDIEYETRQAAIIARRLNTVAKELDIPGAEAVRVLKIVGLAKRERFKRAERCTLFIMQVHRPYDVQCTFTA